MNPTNGKGSKRRKEDGQKVRKNWPLSDPFERRMAQKRKEESERRKDNEKDV